MHSVYTRELTFAEMKAEAARLQEDPDVNFHIGLVDMLIRRLEKYEERRFKIISGPTIPWRLIAPWEMQAKLNHGGQSLETLDSRGGLSPGEALAVMTGRPYRTVFPYGTHETHATLDAFLKLVKERDS